MKKYSMLIFSLLFCIISVSLGLLVGHRETVIYKFEQVSVADFSSLPLGCCIEQRGELLIVANQEHYFFLKNKWPTTNYEQTRNNSHDKDINKLIPKWRVLVDTFIGLPIVYLEKDSLGNITVKISDRHCIYEFVKVVNDRNDNRYINYTKMKKDWIYMRYCDESIFHKNI